MLNTKRILLVAPAAGVAIGFAGLLGVLGQGTASATVPASSIAGYTAASWWSPGCVTWHTSDGACVGGEEARGFGKGFSCAGQAAPPWGLANLGDKDWRDKCLNLEIPPA